MCSEVDDKDVARPSLVQVLDSSAKPDEKEVCTKHKPCGELKSVLFNDSCSNEL